MPEEKTQNQQSEEHRAGGQDQAAGTKRKPYENDRGDPANEEPIAADEDVTDGQENQPGLPDPEQEPWSPGSGSETP